MKKIFKKVVVFSLLGILLTGIGASATEASARQDHNGHEPRYEQQKRNYNSNRDHHIQEERAQRERELERQREERRLAEERAQHEREMRHREQHDDKDDDNDLAVGLGALALLAVVLDN